jgi:8-oxo-dGTP diphosphatase
MILSFTVNPYGGVVITPAELPKDPNDFQAGLESSLAQWTKQGYKLVWLELPIKDARFIPFATELGFKFHHATEAYLMLTYKLLSTAPSLAYASHYVGVGGVVINDRQELLVVRENMRGEKANPYKLPGGFLEPNEHVVDGVVREVREETGIQAKFESLVCVRHWHANRFGKSDFYFVCRLSPLTLDITAQEAEISECRWMPVEDYLGRDDIYAFNKEIVSLALKDSGWQSGWFDGYEANRIERELFMPRG